MKINLFKSHTLPQGDKPQGAEPDQTLKMVKRVLFLPWMLIKVAIYLLVAYSVLFTLSLSYGAYKAYEFVDSEIHKVKQYQTQEPTTTAFMQLTQQKLSEDSLEIKQQFVPMDSISTYLQDAVVAVEDAAFFQHPGIHIESILNALETNKRRGKKSHGGSTITQQLAKNLFLSPEKSFQRKIREAIYTFMMEKYLGKERILELYLNYAQFGKNLFGCEAAAQHYYKTTCAKLNFNQSIQLATVLANPNKYRPGQRGSRLLAQRRRIIYENFYAMRKISLETFTQITGDQPRRVKEEAYKKSINDISKPVETKKEAWQPLK